MSGHYKEECVHGTMGGQCRCPSKDKAVRIIPCPNQCPRKNDHVPLTDEELAENYKTVPPNSLISSLIADLRAARAEAERLRAEVEHWKEDRPKRWRY